MTKSSTRSPGPPVHLYIVAVGSNIDAELNYGRLLTILEQEQDLVATASAIWTKPEDYLDQADFLNSAVALRTTMDAMQLKAWLKELEIRLGRVKGPIKAGPRTMDLDIIIQDGRLMDAEYLHRDYIQAPVDQLLAVLGIAPQSDEYS
ncbi:MAG: 2-amino-4-hydroxy-6-hydroxymethyldihydropteridine diphosphokinase [Leptospiraceae bacterium]|nr:2-amino-4-hydroxy-6-hydroxymethyldihydropteridine diphosphokinase [Leptospiraceae bacterium]